MTEDLLICNSPAQHFSKSLPANNVTMSIGGIDVVFEVVEGKFNVEYAEDMATESAEVFFECLKDYFSAHIFPAPAQNKDLESRKQED